MDNVVNYLDAIVVYTRRKDLKKSEQLRLWVYNSVMNKTK